MNKQALASLVGCALGMYAGARYGASSFTGDTTDLSAAYKFGDQRSIAQAVGGLVGLLLGAVIV
jgi:hypothetical protein